MTQFVALLCCLMLLEEGSTNHLSAESVTCCARGKVQVLVIVRKAFSVTMLALLLASMLTSAFIIHPVKASGTIYIRADGSIDPPTTAIATTDNVTYTFTGDIYDSIIVERDNITIDGAGYRIEGTGVAGSTGLALVGREHVSVRNMCIRYFHTGIWLDGSSHNTISGNTLTANTNHGCGIENYSNNNTISGNDITANAVCGVKFEDYCSNNTVKENNVTSNQYGIHLYASSNNTISRNTVILSSSSDRGVSLFSSNNNTIVGNDIAASRRNNQYGIYLEYSLDHGVCQNSVTNAWNGIHLEHSSNNAVALNSVTTNSNAGIKLKSESNHNSITKNNVTGNLDDNLGLQYGSNYNNITENALLYSGSSGFSILDDSANNTVAANSIIGNADVAYLYGSSGNTIYHNIINNTSQYFVNQNSQNAWDNGYPSGGNYWSDYASSDICYGEYQNETGSDGIGDAPYVIDSNNRDSYPLMRPYVPFENQTIYIRADGSIDPSGAPILRKGDLYTLTGNVLSDSDGIVIEKDYITLDGAGCTVQGPTMYDWKGIILVGRSNVTIKNAKISGFHRGIFLDSSSNNTISGNNLTGTVPGGRGFFRGISLEYSTANSVCGNSVVHAYEGIYVGAISSFNIIAGNNITDQVAGIYVTESSDHNIICENNVTANIDINFWAAAVDNRIYHNNFMNMTVDSRQWPSEAPNDWDDGYPIGGNFWSDYNGTDLGCGAFQNETGSDGIGDTPYVIDADNTDHYPLMKPYPWAAHDIGIAGFSPSKNIVGRGCNVSFYAMLFNYGNDSETLDVTVYANSTGIATQTANVSGRNYATLFFTWDTSGLNEYDEYVIWAYAGPVLGEIDFADNNVSAGSVLIAHIGDITGDKKVDIQDLARVSAAFGSVHIVDWGDPRFCQCWHQPACPTCPHSPNTDVNGDGRVDIADLARTSGNFGWYAHECVFSSGYSLDGSSVWDANGTNFFEGTNQTRSESWENWYPETDLFGATHNFWWGFSQYVQGSSTMMTNGSLALDGVFTFNLTDVGVLGNTTVFDWSSENWSDHITNSSQGTLINVTQLWLNWTITPPTELNLYVRSANITYTYNVTIDYWKTNDAWHYKAAWSYAVILNIEEEAL